MMPMMKPAMTGVIYANGRSQQSVDDLSWQIKTPDPMWLDPQILCEKIPYIDIW